MESNCPESISDPSCLREELLRGRHELQILFDISSAIHSSPRLEDVLQQSLMSILRTLNFKMGVIYLAQETDEGTLFRTAAQHGFASSLGDAIQLLSLTPQQVERLCFRQQVKRFTSDKIIFAPLRERMKVEQIAEIICISLFTHTGLQGLLYVTNHGPLRIGPERGEFLASVGRQIGVAIENARLFDSIQRAKSELEISFDAIQHSIFIIDSRRRIFRTNRTGTEVYGNKGDLPGKRFESVVYGPEGRREDCPVEECFRTGGPVQREGAHPRWGGYYSFHAFPVTTLAGRVERVVYYEKDATENKRLEQRLQQSDRLKALGTLAAGIAHEIRNPLATINFNAQMLNRDLKLSPVQEQMFSDLLGEVKKIDAIVQQVLHFARPKEPQFLANRLEDVVTYCYDLSKVHLRKANIEVSMELAENLPAITMDFNQISQVVMNLLINAIEAMPDGGKLRIGIDRSDEPSALILRVGDTGSGILEEDKSRIFDPFFTRKPDGTGLGLSISRQILENHGAYMELESVAGQGTTIRVVFPLGISESP